MDACRARLACVLPARGRRTPVESSPAAGRLSLSIIPASLRLAGLARLCGATGGRIEPFDAASFEAERLRLDAEARRSMAEVSSRVAAEEGAVDGEDPRAWKWRIRKRIWDLMEKENIARDPRPVHHRIPNFAGAATAASMVAELDEFRRADCVKVNPDSPQKQVRFLTLSEKLGGVCIRQRRTAEHSQEAIAITIYNIIVLRLRSLYIGLRHGAYQDVTMKHEQAKYYFCTFLTGLHGGKKLLTPQPRLRTGFFSILEAGMVASGAINEACTSVGVAKYGRAIGLDEKLKVDLIVIGSVAVDPKTGARLGKGEGFAELEYGMLRYMGAIDDSTMIITSVHDKQLVDDIPVEKLLVHDVPVDIVCTPTQIIYTNTTIPKPQGIYWEKLSPEKLGQIRILRELKSRIEQETGQKLPCGPSEKLSPTAQRAQRNRRYQRRNQK